MPTFAPQDTTAGLRLEVEIKDVIPGRVYRELMVTLLDPSDGTHTLYFICVVRALAFSSIHITGLRCPRKNLAVPTL